ncbi:DUF1304 domain-containing protein [Aeromicrobium alkaliterrae]|uniref:DUF1304 domain-containing protein n=1 Tax=Aeromicrobium alkaliterrae TaxID=302168 RepID=A0ABN2JJL8_9ACTN
MVVAGLVAAGLAAALHVYIFWLESLVWTGPRARATFGVRTAEDAEITRPLAFNQGFYNLFLTIEIVIGTIVHATGNEAVGLTLVLVGTGSMVAAALVLLLSSPDKARAAVVQGLFPLVAIVLLVLGSV